MDVCIRKPIIATCSMDKSIRVWNYENKSVHIVYNIVCCQSTQNTHLPQIQTNRQTETVLYFSASCNPPPMVATLDGV